MPVYKSNEEQVEAAWGKGHFISSGPDTHSHHLREQLSILRKFKAATSLLIKFLAFANFHLFSVRVLTLS